jgi:hypothetical protein
MNAGRRSLDMAIRLGRNVLAPSGTRAPRYDTSRRDTGTYQFSCVRCAAPVPVAFDALIDSAWDYERVLDAGLLGLARERFGIGTPAKAPDGGFVSLHRTKCAACGTSYLVYAGVREPSSGWYQVTVQGVVELIGEE